MHVLSFMQNGWGAGWTVVISPGINMIERGPSDLMTMGLKKNGMKT